MEGANYSADPIHLLVCDDHYLIREGLKAALSHEADCEVVAEAETAEEALTLVSELLPDVVVMDVLLPSMDGIEATRRIKQNYPSVAVIVLTRFDDTKHIMEIYSAGAAAYLGKYVGATELVTTIRAVFGGGVVLHPHIADAVIRSFSRPNTVATGSAQANLSSRELNVLRLLARGLTNKEIARELSISVRTAENHITNIFGKLGLNDRVSAAVYAVSQGIARPGEDLRQCGY